jgi:hypothetical protein
VEKVVVVVNNMNQLLVRVRIVQDRIPELGDKFSNRHGQKGTAGAMLRGHDMPRTASGIVPDMIMNPHAIPSRMTIGQNIEQLFGKALAAVGSIGDGTAFMNSESPEGPIGAVLEEMGYEKYGNEILYNGMTGEQCKAAIFMGPVYAMRLKHMVEDKWQARGQGRKIQMTHQPTGGRGNQGGLKIGEMDRDALVGHSIASFFQESFMKRSDGSTMPICTSCGTVPIHNPRMRISQCTLCDGPPVFMGDTINTLELLPPMHRQKGRIVNVEIPYATKVLTQELSAITNITLRFITSGDTAMLRPFEPPAEGTQIVKELKQLELPEIVVPEIIEEEEKAPGMTIEELAAYGIEAAKLVQAARSAAAEKQEVVDEEAMITEIPMGAVVDQGGVPVDIVPSPGASQNKLSAEDVKRLRAVLAADGSEEESPVLRRLPSVAPQELPGIGEVAPARVLPPPMSGLPPTIAVEQAKAPVFVVPTDDAAMAEAGLPPLSAPQGSLRPMVLRRSANNVGFSAAPAPAPSASGPIMVTKLGAE